MGLAKVGSAFLTPPTAPADGSLWYFDPGWGWRSSGSQGLTFDGTNLLLGVGQHAIGGIAASNASVSISDGTGSLTTSVQHGMLVDYRANSNASAGTARGAFYRVGTASGSFTVADMACLVTGNIVVGSGTTVTLGKSLQLGKITGATNNVILTSSSSTGITGNYFIYDDSGYANSLSGATTISNSTASTSTTSGALVVTGGAGIGGDVYIGGHLNNFSGFLTVLGGSGTSWSPASSAWTGSALTLAVAGTSDPTHGIIAFEGYGDSSNARGGIFSMRSKRDAPGTYSTSAQAGDVIAVISFEAVSSSALRSAGYIESTVVSASGTTVSADIQFHVTNTSGTDLKALSVSGQGSVVLGNPAALATNATDGFAYIPTSAGAPTGTPTAVTGKVAMEYDTTNNKLWVYNGAWKGVVLS